MDSLLEQIQGVRDTDRLSELYEAVQRAVAEEVPALHTVYVPRTLAVGSRIRGVGVGLNGPFGSLADWWIPPARRRATR